MLTGPTILAVGRALPKNYVDQETLIAALQARWAKQHFNAERLSEIHRRVRVAGRHLALPIEQYETLGSFAKANAKWSEIATELGSEAITNALRQAGAAAEQVNHLFFVTVTGVSTPSLDARLVNRLSLHPSIKRTPMFGLGCVAGAAGTARAADYLKSFPDDIAVLLSVELCSLTIQKEDFSVANVIATGLFGDGAAAVVMAGSARGTAGPQVVGTRSIFYRDTERLMGWNIAESGFRVVLSSKVPDVVRLHIRGDVDAFLAEHSLRRQDIVHWVVHTGGPKVLEAFEKALELPKEALARSWKSLEEVGNLSSASVLFVLGDVIDSGDARPGDWGLMIAMGPGFCAELVLMKW